MRPTQRFASERHYSAPRADAPYCLVFYSTHAQVFVNVLHFSRSTTSIPDTTSRRNLGNPIFFGINQWHLIFHAGDIAIIHRGLTYGISAHVTSITLTEK